MIFRSRAATPRRKSVLARLFRQLAIERIETLQSGLPFTRSYSYNPSTTATRRNPVRLLSILISPAPSSRVAPLIFNPTPSFSLCPNYGNAGRNILQGPRSSETDASLTRNFHSMRALPCNSVPKSSTLFNHTSFNTPKSVVYAAANGLPSPTAGVIISTSTSSRQIQFGLKLLW